MAKNSMSRLTCRSSPPFARVRWVSGQDSGQDRFALDLDLGLRIDQGRDLDQGHRREVLAEGAAPGRADRRHRRH